MTLVGSTGLGLLAIALGAAIALELVDHRGGTADTSAARPPNTLPVATGSPHGHDANVGAILARPVFSPDRRPLGAGTQTAAGLSRLTGIVITQSRKLAIFAAPSGEQPLIAEEGAHINAYEVMAITASGVTVAGPGGTTVVTPVFDPSPPAVPRPTMATRPKPHITSRR